MIMRGRTTPGFIMKDQRITVSQFIEAVNGLLDCGLQDLLIEGEVSSFKVNQGKWVFFDLKDEDGATVNCFLPVFQLRTPIEDGMKIVVKGLPKVTNWGRFSLTVKQLMPVGEGNIKKSYELLKKKLTAEGLFDAAKKRGIPADLTKIGVISSTQAAGYADFCKILNARWGGLEVQTAHTQVQGIDAPDQIIRALRYFNEKAEVQIIAIIRGGGSADDLSAFNDEKLVREIAASRIPVITGIGHEVDESLSDLAADIRASTPSNVAEMLTRDRKAEMLRVRQSVQSLGQRINQEIGSYSENVKIAVTDVKRQLISRIENIENTIKLKKQMLDGMNPERVLRQGYAIVGGELTEGNLVKITTFNTQAEAEIKSVKKKG